MDYNTVLHKKKGLPTGGTTQGYSGLYTGSDGIDRYVKQYSDPTQIYSEHLANWIYKQLGLNAPNSHIIDKEDIKLYVSDIVEHLNVLANTEFTPDIARKLAKGFAADVLLANWDALGAYLHNIVINADGDVSRIDNGGTLLMRARGGRKPESSLDSIEEYTTFFNPKNRYSQMMLLAGYERAEDMAEELIEQISKIENMAKPGWDKIVSRVIPEWSGSDKDRVIQMLESRTRLLSERKKELLTQLNRIRHIAYNARVENLLRKTFK